MYKRQPFDRGILSSVYADPVRKVAQKDLDDLYRTFYAHEHFVRVLDAPPGVKHVARTNYCHVFATVAKGKIVCFSAIDNLVKGASGQAIQNMNLVFGLDETMGLL